MVQSGDYSSNSAAASSEQANDLTSLYVGYALILFAVPTWALMKVVPNQWFALVPMLLHVPVSELVQANLLPGRGGEWWDAVADLVGIAVGWWTVRSTARFDEATATE